MAASSADRSLLLPVALVATVAAAVALIVGLDAGPTRLRAAELKANEAAPAAASALGLAGPSPGPLHGLDERDAPAVNPAHVPNLPDLRLPGALPPLRPIAAAEPPAQQRALALVEDLAATFERTVEVLAGMPLDLSAEPQLARQEADAVAALVTAIAEAKRGATALEGALSEAEEAEVEHHAQQRLGPLLQRMAQLHPAALQRLGAALGEATDGDLSEAAPADEGAAMAELRQPRREPYRTDMPLR